MAPHRSPASYDKYIKKMEEGQETLKAQGLPALEITLRPGVAYPIRVLSTPLPIISRMAFAQLTPEDKERHRAELIFTTHSIPRAMAHKSPYSHQFEETCQQVMPQGGDSLLPTAYTSRSGRPEEAWLEPDLGDFIERRTYETLSACVVAPIGFLVDHVEVLYDIDVLAQDKAKWKGLHMVRAKSRAAPIPLLVAMLAGLVEESLNPV